MKTPLIDTSDPATAPALECACFNLRKATRTITQIYDEMMRPSGLRVTQFTLLTALRTLGPQSVSVLAEHLGMERTTLTRNLAVLERSGLVRIAAGEDQRVREVSASAKGEAAREKAFPYWVEAQARVAESLGTDRLGRLLGDLRDLTTRTRG